MEGACPVGMRPGGTRRPTSRHSILLLRSEESLQRCAEAVRVILSHSEVRHYSYPPLSECANREAPQE